VKLAREAGFTALSLFIEDYEQARESGLSNADIRSLLSDNGLAVGELDPLLTWVPGSGDGAERRGFLRYGEDDFYRVADAIEARSVNAVCFDAEVPSQELLVEALAGLCDRAAGHDLLVHVEFMPWSAVANAQVALEIVQRADRPNAGIMLDTWHHFRSGLANDVLREIPGDRLLAVQLNDAHAEPRGHIIHETLHDRLPFGEGAIDLPQVLRILDEIGAVAPLGVEVFCDDLAALGPEAEIRRLGEDLRRLRQQAQG